MKKQDSKLEKFTAMVEKNMDKIQIYNSYLDQMNLTKAQYSITEVPDNKKAPPSEGENSTNISGMWNIIIIIIIIATIKGSAPVLNSLMEYLLIA